MSLKSPHRPGSPLTLCLILVIGIALLAPLYHGHAHEDDLHHENGDVHDLLHDRSLHEGLFAGQKHIGSHLHIKRDIGRTDTQLHFKGKPVKTDLCSATASSVRAAHISCRHTGYAQTFIVRRNSSARPSGLSPPVV